MTCTSSNLKALKNIVVTGATGQQGGALISSLLKNHSNLFTVTAVTRNTSSIKAISLLKRGVTVK
jgi:uncharacterized protein YbjT (DUF2867 family)